MVSASIPARRRGAAAQSWFLTGIGTLEKLSIGINLDFLYVYFSKNDRQGILILVTGHIVYPGVSSRSWEQLNK